MSKALSEIRRIAKLSYGQGDRITQAVLGGSAENAMAGRHFQLLSSCEKPKGRISDRETGKGGCDCGCGRRWKDWVSFVRVVRQIPEMADAAKEVAAMIGGKYKQGRRGTKEKAPADPLKGIELLSPVLVKVISLQWCKHKPPITPQAIEAIGGRVANRYGEKVLAFPVWGPEGSKADPINWACVKPSGKPFKWVDKKTGEPRSEKIMTSTGCPNGFFGRPEDIDSMLAGKASGRVFSVEGPTDLLSLLSAGINKGDIVVSNAFGARTCKKLPSWMLKAFAGCRVVVIHDADEPGQEGAAGLVAALLPIATDVRNPKLPYPVETAHGKDIRDALSEGGYKPADFYAWADATEPSQPPTPAETKAITDSRDVIVWSDNEKELVESTIESLAKSPDIYQRGSELYGVTESSHPLSPTEKVMRVRRLPLAHLRTLITSQARFVVDTGEELRPKTVTDTLARQVDCFGDYPGVRELLSVSEFPFLREDGSVCTKNGYDAQSRTFLKTSIDVDLPSEPTQSDAAAAADRILELVSDFEFKEPHHRSAWFAGLLTVFAKPAIRGCVPVFVIEASVQGSGKTRLVDMISTLATGRTMTRNPWPSKDDEVSKGITAIVLSGIPLVLFDNCKSMLGGSSIEALCTSEYWKSRILGESRETPELPIRQVFFFTGNNCSLSEDMARRGCFTRLEPSVANPDSRSGFKIPDLLGHIKTHRAELVRDALVVLLAFRRSGERPKIAHWGGYESWSELIRGAIAWLGLDDPHKGTLDAKEATLASDILPSLLDALQDAGLDEFSAADVVRRSEEIDSKGDFLYPNLREVVLSACGDRKISPQRVGKTFQRFDGRVHGDRKFSSLISREKKKEWRITALPAGSAGSCRESGGQSRKNENSGNGGSVASDNPTAGPITPCNSLHSLRCSPSCDPADCTERTDGSWIETTCGRCKRFFGRRPAAAGGEATP